MVGGDLGEGLRAKADGVVASLDDGGVRLHILGGILAAIGRAVVGKALFLEVMMMPPHILFALLLIFICLGGDLLPVEVNFMSGGVLLRSIVSQFEVMCPEVFQLRLVQLGYLGMVPGLQQDFVCRRKVTFVIAAQTAASEGVQHWHVIRLGFLLGVLFVVDRAVVLGG